MGQTRRPMPVRQDLWKPEDPILDNIIRRCLNEAESAEGSEGSSTIMAGTMVLAVLGVLILMAAKSAHAAIVVPLILGGVGFAYMVVKSGQDRGPRHATLTAVGGAGRLPAGYLVHPDAWEAGVAEHVVYVPESQLQAAVQLCRTFPGTIDDLLSFTASIAEKVPPVHGGHADVQRRTREMVRIGAPVLREFIANNPPRPVATGGGKKGK